MPRTSRSRLLEDHRRDAAEARADIAAVAALVTALNTAATPEEAIATALDTVRAVRVGLRLLLAAGPGRR